MYSHLEELKLCGRPKRKWEIKLEEQNKEITRLNNIIDELEKYINKMIKEDSKYNDIASRYGVLNCKNILDKLKELKEGK